MPVDNVNTPFDDVQKETAGMLRSIIFGQIRGLLSALFGYLAVHGYLSNDDATAGVTSVLFILNLAWSAFEKWKTEQNHKAEVASLS